MIIPRYARYDYCVYKAYEFLYEFFIVDYPVDAHAIIAKKKWGLVKYSEIAKHFNCSIRDVIRMLGSEDGFTIYDGYNYTIAYNDLKKPKNRILFTLLHEIGHIYLNHLIDFEATRLYRGSLTKEENKVLENESNAFARNVLVPALIIKSMKNQSSKNVATRFGITKSAAEARLGLLEADLISINACDISYKALDIYIRYRYKKTCRTCGHFFIIPNAKHCPICGSTKFKNERSKIVIYESMNTYSNNKLTSCPRCDNEETDIEGLFCQICGVMLVNKCDDRSLDGILSPAHSPCGGEVPVNARYCPKCGCNTTFYNDGLLEDWKIEKKKREPRHFFNFSEDEELPFN